MKAKKPATIPEGIKELEGLSLSYYEGYFTISTMQSWAARVAELHAWYVDLVKKCMSQAFQKNLTSRLTYQCEINSVRYFELSILSESRQSFRIASNIGIPFREDDFKRNTQKNWDEFSVSILLESLRTLQLFFDHLNDESLPKQWD